MKLYMLWKNGYQEDYVFAYEDSPQNAVLKYCEETGRPPMTLDEFWDNYSYDEITMIGDRVIKEIIFE